MVVKKCGFSNNHWYNARVEERQLQSGESEYRILYTNRKKKERIFVISTQKKDKKQQKQTSGFYNSKGTTYKWGGLSFGLANLKFQVPSGGIKLNAKEMFGDVLSRSMTFNELNTFMQKLLQNGRGCARDFL